MQEALKGKNRVYQLDVTDCMPSDAECSFSNDSLDDRAIKDESSQKDSSTVISEFSSTKTLMNIGDEIRSPFNDDEVNSKKYFLSRRYSDSMKAEENTTGMQYFRQTDASHREQVSTAFISEAQFREKERIKRDVEFRYASCTLPSENKKSILDESMANNVTKYSAIEETYVALSVTKLKDISISNARNMVTTKIKEHKQEYKQNEVEISSIPKQSPSKTECAKYITCKENIGKLLTTVESLSTEDTFEKTNKDCSISNEISMDISIESKKKKTILNFDDLSPPRYKRRIQENFDPNTKKVSPEIPKSAFYLSSIEKNDETSNVNDQNKLGAQIHKTEKPSFKLTYDYRRKYHTYPKSRIPIPKRSRERRFENYADPRMFPLEPREINLESFQQLHTADSQEELQEFLLLESQCSGNLGLAANILSMNEVDCSYAEHCIEDEGTMSGRISFNTNKGA